MRKSEKRQRDHIISVRMTDAEADVVRRRAEFLGLSVSSFLRIAVLWQRAMEIR